MVTHGNTEKSTMPVKTENRHFSKIAQMVDLSGNFRGQNNMCAYLSLSLIFKLLGRRGLVPTDLKKYIVNWVNRHGDSADAMDIGAIAKNFDCIIWLHEFDTRTSQIANSSPCGIPEKAAYEIHLGYDNHYESTTLVSSHGTSVAYGHFVIVDIVETHGEVEYYLGFGYNDEFLNYAVKRYHIDPAFLYNPAEGQYSPAMTKRYMTKAKLVASQIRSDEHFAQLLANEDDARLRQIQSDAQFAQSFSQ